MTELEGSHPEIISVLLVEDNAADAGLIGALLDDVSAPVFELTHVTQLSHLTGTAGNYVKIELLKNGTVNRIITTSARMGTGGAGSYYWNIPYNQTSGNDYQIRITSTSNSSVSDMGNGVFTIP